MNYTGKELIEIEKVEFASCDKWILKKLNIIIAEVTKNIEKYEFGLALGKLYDFIWNDFCDWYIELTKPVLYSDDEKGKRNALSILNYLLKTILKLIHPFTPFITEEIWDQFNFTTLMLEKYPVENQLFNFENENFEIIKDIISKIRNIRAEMNVPVTKKLPLFIICKDKTYLINENRKYIEKLAGISDICFVNDKEEIGEKVSQAATNDVELFIPLGKLIDFDKEIERLTKEKEKIENEIMRGERMLSNKGFVAKAPEKLINLEKEKLENNILLKEKIISQIENIKG